MFEHVHACSKARSSLTNSRHQRILYVYSIGLSPSNRPQNSSIERLRHSATSGMESSFRIKLLPMPIALPDRSARLSGYTTHCRIVNGLITSCTCVAPQPTGSSRSDDVNSDERSVVEPSSTTVTPSDDDDEQWKQADVDSKVSAPSDDVIQKMRLKKTLEKAKRERERTRIMAGAFRALNDVLPRFTYGGKRVSQLCLLRTAASYIRTLEHLLTLTPLDGDNTLQSEPAVHERRGQGRRTGRSSCRSSRKRNCRLCDQHPDDVYVSGWTYVRHDRVSDALEAD